MITNPDKVKRVCPHCGKPLFFRTEEERKKWNWDKNGAMNGQADLKNWYFYCGCADGEKWTWCIAKDSGEWKYHDWKSGKWKNEIPDTTGEKVQFT